MQAADKPQKGGLARAVFAHDAVDGPLGHRDVEVVQSLEAAVGLSKGAGLQNVFHRVTSFW